MIEYTISELKIVLYDINGIIETVEDTISELEQTVIKSAQNKKQRK